MYSNAIIKHSVGFAGKFHVFLYKGSYQLCIIRNLDQDFKTNTCVIFTYLLYNLTFLFLRTTCIWTVFWKFLLHVKLGFKTKSEVIQINLNDWPKYILSFSKIYMRMSGIYYVVSQTIPAIGTGLVLICVSFLVVCFRYR